MARIAGVDLPLNKHVQIGLTYIYGIGKSRAAKICGEAGVNLTTKVKDLTEDETLRIRNIIQRDGMVEGDLRKAISMDIKRLMEIGSYRGLRHRHNQHRATVELQTGRLCQHIRCCLARCKKPLGVLPL